ncbi:MAG: type II toxin-antitoxin system VapC family toxin [Planctomycetes bacterium]|nr:type II toxin-antitoxin system VapC family toxin [Planctomycetota bacterium]
MRGIDTNVLVRYIVQDDPSQAEAASAFVEELSEHSTAIIDLTVLIELVWVLSKAYGYSKKNIEQVIEQVLITDCFIVEFSEIAWSALKEYKDGNADFSDYCIGISNLKNGASHTVTFDQKAAKNELFTLLK